MLAEEQGWEKSLTRVVASWLCKTSLRAEYLQTCGNSFFFMTRKDVGFMRKNV
jgi:hypothetical protein